MRRKSRRHARRRPPGSPCGFRRFARRGYGHGAVLRWFTWLWRTWANVYNQAHRERRGRGKVVALSALDMVRRLAQKQPVDRARMFEANS